MDFYLNVLQSIQLPFALVPLIKFVGSKDIMGDFAISRPQVAFASGFGFLLFIMNFVEIYNNAKVVSVWIMLLIIIASLIYISFIIIAIREPLSPLRKMTKEEIEDHEYDRVEVDAEISQTWESDDNIKQRLM